MKSTKIVATIGPSTDKLDTIYKLIKKGVDVVRLNFSHGSYDYFKDIIEKVRQVDEGVAILLDTKGPEIRSGKIKENGVLDLKSGNELTFTKKEILGTNDILTINYDKLEKIQKGNLILIDDGLIEFEVIDKKKEDLRVRVINSGKLGSNKTVCIQGHNVEIPFLSKKDKEDILFGLNQNVSFVAASFVRKREDIIELRDFINKYNPKVKIISKIEHADAVKNIDEIIELSDGIMVARGDLGVEICLQKVPQIQRDIINKCNIVAKPVIVATQMLESMKENPRPTRAEVSDVAEAILEGTDAIMLSGETANGDYPLESVEMFVKIAKEYDKKVKHVFDRLDMAGAEFQNNSISSFVSHSAYLASKRLNLSAILTPTETGTTARKVSRFKPKCPILAITPDIIVARQLKLSWGIFPTCEITRFDNVDNMTKILVEKSFKTGIIKKEDKVVVTAGDKLLHSGHTNMLKIIKVEDALKR